MTYQTVNPFNNQLIKTYPDHTDKQAAQALETAHRLFLSEWSGDKNIDARLSVLLNLSQIMNSRVDELSQTISTEMGKLIGQSREEVLLCAHIAQYYAEHAKAFLTPVQYESTLGDAWVEYHPIGVLLAVEPWNFPFYQLMRVMAPNLAAGNPVLVKHASIVPHCAETFEKLLTEAGAPKGAYTNLFITPEQVGTLIDDDRIAGVALTGSEKAGRVVASRTAKSLKKSTMELGGNDVFVVLDDSDLEKAIRIGAAARLNNAGQVCTAAKRFILHETIADAFVAGLKQAFANVKMGDPLDETTTLGPLSSESALSLLSQQVEQALQKGAKLICGGKPAERDGFFFEPTILSHIERTNPAYFDEFFGPVALIFTIKDDDEIVKLANDSHFGLGGAIFSSNIARAKKLASKIATGMVYINSLTSTAPELPFGGIKRSGYGRELSDLGIKEFVNQKLIVVADE